MDTTFGRIMTATEVQRMTLSLLVADLLHAGCPLTDILRDVNDGVEMAAERSTDTPAEAMPGHHTGAAAA